MKIVRPAAVLVVTLAAACSSSNGGSSADAQGFAQQYCALIAPCCADAGLSTNGSQCEALISALTATSTYNATAGAACITAERQASASPGFCAGAGSSAAVCEQVFSAAGTSGGTKQPGEACTTDADCAPAAGGGATCWMQTTFGDAGTSTTATCIQTTVGASGDAPCLGTINGGATFEQWSGSAPPPDHAYTCNVADGLSCNATTAACTTLSTTGESCDDDSDCVPADYCDYSTTGGAECAARIADGGACPDMTGCATTSYCDATSQTCKALLGAGAACTDADVCQSSECLNGACSSPGGGFGLTTLCGG